MIGNNISLAYAKNIVILGESKRDLMTIKLKLLKTNFFKMGPTIYENKTKYMIITRKPITTRETSGLD